ncbi:MAG: hypothetical protein CGW95_13400 [Phenylobacterium zucineum]|nr:MAG: hypothetical protein CGW95_13400 [Phenylobacterium zucineum]
MVAILRNNAKLIFDMAPHLQRVVIVDSSPGGARVLRDGMREFASGEIHCFATPGQAFEFVKAFNPQLFLIDFTENTSDALQFVRDIRRSYMPCRRAPIIAATSNATAEVIFASRDAGVHEFLVRPFKPIDLSNRLQVVTLRSREWVEGVLYVGPDRRRFNSASFMGPKKRLVDGGITDTARLQQTLKIVEFAIAFKDQDPSQALRALRAQSEVLLDLGTRMSDSAMVKQAQEFLRYVTCMTEFDLAKTGDLLEVAVPLLRRLKDSLSGGLEFDTDIKDEEVRRLKQWKTYVAA